MKIEYALETTGQDWANHLSHEISGSGIICLALLLSTIPDPDILYKAAEDVITLQPVLGCRFDDTQDPPIWVRTSGSDWFTQAEADSLELGLNAFIQGGMPQGRQFCVRLLTCPGQTVLCLLFDHASTDGAGAKACLSLLCDCYNQRCNGGCGPKPGFPNRLDAQIFARCGISDFRMALKREAPPAGPIRAIPYRSMAGQRVMHRWVSLPVSALGQPGFTANDLLLAAYAWAIYGMGLTESQITIHMTVDLRRYLDAPSAPAACNLSGMESVTALIAPGETFSSTLKSIVEQTALIKSGRPGMGSAAMMAYLRTMPYKTAREMLVDAAGKTRESGAAAPILSNLGLLPHEPLRFGSVHVTGIVPLLPALHAPAFMLGALSFGDTLTLSAGFYEEERDAAQVERLLHSMRELLLSCGKQ